MNTKKTAITIVAAMMAIAMITTVAMATNCFEPCGTKIEQCTNDAPTKDAVYALVIPGVTGAVPGMQLAWRDADSDGQFEFGECAYIDTNAAGGVVQQGDIRLCGSCGEDPNTPVIACDSEMGQPLTIPAQTVLGYVDINGNGYYDLDDPLYLDAIDVGGFPGGGIVSVGDIRLTGRTDGSMNFPAYSVVNNSDFDITSNPNNIWDPIPFLAAQAAPFNNLNDFLGFVDTDCDNAWDVEGRDKLYLQQIVDNAVLPLPLVTGVLYPFESFVTIGDFRLFMPVDEPCWPDCGTKVKQCDPDAEYAVLIPGVDAPVTTGVVIPGMELNWVDKNSNLRFDSGDNVYIDTNPSILDPSVSAGDVRLTAVCGCTPNTVVGVCGWCDIGDPFINAPAPFLPNADQFLVGFVDINANGIYDLGDPLYLDTSDLGAPGIGNSVVSANDIRLTGRTDVGPYDSYSIVKSGEMDTWVNPVQLLDIIGPAHGLIPAGSPINDYLGFVDSNCDGIWATDGTDKLYLQQMVIVCPNVAAVANQFDKFATIGDFRLYMPTDEPCWPDCGTKVEQCDVDAVYGLLIPGVTITLDVPVPVAMQFAFWDISGDGFYDIGECAYIDTNANGVTDVGDVRLTECCNIPPNTVVKDCDCDFGMALVPPAQNIVGYLDLNGNTVYDVSDPLYLDTDTGVPGLLGIISPGDIRLTGRTDMGPYAAYTTVQPGDDDETSSVKLLLDPKTNAVLPLTPIGINLNYYLGFIDSECDHVWDPNGEDKLYLQQMSTAPSGVAFVEPQFNQFSTIGDFRIYMPPVSVNTTICEIYDVNPTNGQVDMAELMAAIGDWKANIITMPQLMDVIGCWKHNTV